MTVSILIHFLHHFESNINSLSVDHLIRKAIRKNKDLSLDQAQKSGLPKSALTNKIAHRANLGWLLQGT